MVVCGMLACLLITGAAASEVILTADNLNATLKQMQRLRQQMDTDPSTRADGYYQTGMLALDLASVLSEEVALYDSQQGGLIQLALDRTAELGVKIDWVAEKKRFIYNGAAFGEYLKLAPDGAHAGDSAFQLLENEFIRVATGESAALEQAVAHKLDYLQKYANHEQAAEVALLLAIDYRDLWRLARAAVDTGDEARYRDLTLNQFARVIRNYPDTKQARVAAGLQARFDLELQQPADAAVTPDGK